MSQIEVLGDAQQAGGRALDTAVGGVAVAYDALRDPTTPARQARGRGRGINRRVAGDIEAAVGETLALPERLLHRSIRVVRGQAGRKDAVGLAARTVLDAVHVPAGGAASFFARVERETTLPKRAPRTTAATGARATARRAQKGAGGAATPGRGLRGPARRTA